MKSIGDSAVFNDWNTGSFGAFYVSLSNVFWRVCSNGISLILTTYQGKSGGWFYLSKRNGSINLKSTFMNLYIQYHSNFFLIPNLLRICDYDHFGGIRQKKTNCQHFTILTKPLPSVFLVTFCNSSFYFGRHIEYLVHLLRSNIIFEKIQWTIIIFYG